MRILLINHYAGAPELGMEFRPYYMAKEWEKLGHETLIVGGSFSHLRRRQPSDDERVIDGVHYSWVKVNKYVGNGIGRIISMFLFILKLYFRFRHYLGNFQPDIVIASSTYPMDIYPARKIARHYHARFMTYGLCLRWSWAAIQRIILLSELCNVRRITAIAM